MDHGMMMTALLRMAASASAALTCGGLSASLMVAVVLAADLGPCASLLVAAVSAVDL